MNYSPFMSILQREFTQGDCFNSVTLYFIHFIWHFNEGFEKSSISNTNLKREGPFTLAKAFEIFKTGEISEYGE